MTWLSVLSDTYDYLLKNEDISDEDRRLLLCMHTTMQPAYEIRISKNGDFLGASILPKNTMCFIPCSQKSAARKSGIEAHPLCDNLQYIAGRDSQFFNFEKLSFLGLDEETAQLAQKFFNKINSAYDDYSGKLKRWCEWSQNNDKNPFIMAVYRYISKQNVISDLLSCLNKDSFSREDVDLSVIKEKGISYKQFENNLNKNVLKSFVLWKVIDIDLEWQIASPKMGQSWNDYYKDSLNNLSDEKVYCIVSGEKTIPADSYPKKIRHEGDQAKLFSSNDSSGLTFRGRFKDESETAKISYELSQKIHKALSWLMRKAQFNIETQYTIFWTLSNEKFPNCIADDFLDLEEDNSDSDGVCVVEHDYAELVKQRLKGCKDRIPDLQNIYIMSVDNLTPGRLSVELWHEIDSKSYFEYIENWCSDLTIVSSGKHKNHIAKLSSLSKILYGEANKNFYSRMMNTIINDGKIPQDIVFGLFHKVLNSFSCEKTEYIYSNIRNVSSVIIDYLKDNHIKIDGILYGGSVNNENIETLLNIENVDGFLIGGASNNYLKTIDICEKVNNSTK